MLGKWIAVVLVVALSLAACRFTTAPKVCESVTVRGWHQDTTVTVCR